jgi:hypothetical protein
VQNRKRVVIGGVLMALVVVLYIAIPAWTRSSLGLPIFVFIETAILVLTIFATFYTGKRTRTK